MLVQKVKVVSINNSFSFIFPPLKIHLNSVKGVNMHDSQQANWGALTALVSELKRCHENGIATASIAMAYICIDALANLSRPKNKQKVTRADFKKWVDTYLHAAPEQSYQYRGKDMYSARCAFVHTYGSEADLHAQDKDTIMFGYHDGSDHYYQPEENERLALIGTKSLIPDVIRSVHNFLIQCKQDELLKDLVEPRLEKVLGHFPLYKESQTVTESTQDE
jgi:hypothetical protein